MLCKELQVVDIVLKALDVAADSFAAAKTLVIHGVKGEASRVEKVSYMLVSKQVLSVTIAQKNMATGLAWGVPRTVVEPKPASILHIPDDSGIYLG